MMNPFQEICFSYSSQFFTEPQGRLLQIDEMPESISQRLAWEANRPQGDTPSTLAASWLAHSPSLSYTHSWEVLSASTLTGFGEENAAYFLHGDRRSYFSVDDSRSVTPVTNSPPKLTWLSTATTDWLPCVCMCVFYVYVAFQGFFLGWVLRMCVFGCTFFARRCFTGQQLMFKVSALLSGASPAPRTHQPSGPVAIACPGLQQWCILGEEQQ